MKRLCILLLALLLAALPCLAEPSGRSALVSELSFALSSVSGLRAVDRLRLSIRQAPDGRSASLLVKSPWNAPFTLHYDLDEGLFLRDEADGAWFRLGAQGEPLDAERLAALAGEVQTAAEALYQQLLDILAEGSLKQEAQQLFAKLSQAGSSLSFSLPELGDLAYRALERVWSNAPLLARGIVRLAAPLAALREEEAEAFLKDALRGAMTLARELPPLAVDYDFSQSAPWLMLSGEAFTLRLDGRQDEQGALTLEGKVIGAASEPVSLKGRVDVDGRVRLDVGDESADASLRVTPWSDRQGVSAVVLLTGRDRYPLTERLSLDLSVVDGLIGLILRHGKGGAFGLPGKQLVTLSQRPDGFDVRLDLPSLGVLADARLTPAGPAQPFSLKAEGLALQRPFSLSCSSGPAPAQEGPEAPPAGELPLLAFKDALARYFAGEASSGE